MAPGLIVLAQDETSAVMSLSSPASACCGHGAAAPRLEQVGHVAGLHRGRELGLERLVLLDGDVDLHVRMRRHVGIRDGLEVGLAGVAVVMCHQSNSTGAALASDGAAAEGAAADAAVDGAAADGAAADGALVAPVPSSRRSPPTRWWPGLRTCASALTRLDLLLCSPPEDSILRATGAPPTSGTAKVSVWFHIGFDANRNRPIDGRQARRSGVIRVPRRTGRCAAIASNGRIAA